MNLRLELLDGLSLIKVCSERRVHHAIAHRAWRCWQGISTVRQAYPVRLG